jgi:hypothetical protein
MGSRKYDNSDGQDVLTVETGCKELSSVLIPPPPFNRSYRPPIFDVHSDGLEGLNMLLGDTSAYGYFEPTSANGKRSWWSKSAIILRRNRFGL